MIKVKKVNFRANSKTIDKLFELNRISAEVWNECLRLSKQHHLETGNWISQTKLQKLTKGRYPLHSQNIQAVVHKYI